MINSRFIQHSRMFSKCRIGKQFRRVRTLNTMGTPRKGQERPGETRIPEKASRYIEAEDEQPDKLFPQEGIHNGSEDLSLPAAWNRNK